MTSYSQYNQEWIHTEDHLRATKTHHVRSKTGRTSNNNILMIALAKQVRYRVALRRLGPFGHTYKMLSATYRVTADAVKPADCSTIENHAVSTSSFTA
jgi:hypothetical protein